MRIISYFAVAGDDVVAYKHGEKSAQTLSAAGFRNLTFRTYNGYLVFFFFFFFKHRLSCSFLPNSNVINSVSRHAGLATTPSLKRPMKFVIG